VNEVPPSQCGDDCVIFSTSLAQRMNGYVPGPLWEDQPPDCVLLYDTSSVNSATAGEILAANDVILLHLPPYSPNLSAVEPVFADYQRVFRE